MGSLRAALAGVAATLLATGTFGATSTTGATADRATPASADASNSSSPCPSDPATPKDQFRAMWITSVYNIDWPSASGLSASAQRSEFRSWLDLAEQQNMNAVVVQVRPTADAFWPSPHEPWSQWLTGTQGRGPGYDPLAFMVEEAHERGIEFHAWFNPYRVATHTDRTQLHSSHPARQNPSWSFEYNGQLYYNPGIPEVREFVIDAMMDAVINYDIDGAHFDDYFYPYPASGQQIPDQSTYSQYGSGFASIDDWRRDNINRLVEGMSQAITAAKPHVAFGISPFGIWRNSSTDPRGSDTSGLQSYDAIYADTRTWVREGWIDYVTPQLYWYIGKSAADYEVLVPWWSDLVSGTDVHLYVGQAAYKVGDGGAWNDPAELSDHLQLNRDYPEVRGDVFFSASDVRNDPLGAISQLTSQHYSRPALIPARTQLPGTTPSSPVISDATRTANGIAVTIEGDATSYAIYRFDGETPGDTCDFADATHLVGVTRGNGSVGTFTDTSAGDGTYTYHATALSRNHLESNPSSAVTVEAGTGQPWADTVDTTMAGRFTASDAWGTSSWSSERFGDSYRFADPVSASDAAWFSADVPATGDYQVEVWFPSHPDYNSATPYLVATADGTEVVHVDQRSGGGQWVDLGTFTLPGGDRNVVGVSRWTSQDGYVVADAVRLTRV